MEAEYLASFPTVFEQNVKLSFRKTRSCLWVSLVKEGSCLPCKTLFAVLIVMVGVSLTLQPFCCLIGLISIIIYGIYWGLFFINEVKGLGYQISKLRPWRKSMEFVPFERVENIFINEVIFRHRVVFILTLLIKDCSNKPKIFPLFKGLLPRLHCVEIVYKQMKHFIKDS